MASEPHAATTPADGRTPGAAAGSGKRAFGRRVPRDAARLVAGHQQTVARLAYRLLGWRHDVNDVVQDVFVTVLDRFHTFRGDAEIGAWIARITVNHCRSHLRRQRVRRLLFRGEIAEPDEFSVGTARPDHARPEELLDVRRAVRQLPAKYREVVVLSYLEGMSNARIAAVLGISRTAVETRLGRARRRLRERLAHLMDETGDG